MNKKLALAFTSFACALAVACGGSSSSNDPTQSGNEQDITGDDCAPITTLTCAPGYESTTEGRAS